VVNVVLMGPPGSGKGTQASGLAGRRDLVHISTGDMLREAVRSGSELGQRVESVLKAGELVSDDLMMDLIRERLQQDDAQRGWLLDGFPRTVAQAAGLRKLLDEIGVSVDAVIVLEVPDEVIVQRISRRLTCASCGAVTNVADLAPGEQQRCPQCGDGALEQREDDREETVRNRLRVYHERTAPAADTLGETYPLRRVSGMGTPAEVAERIQGVLE